MIRPARAILAAKRISEMEGIIHEGIDKICQREKFQVTYAEINTALANVLRSNLEYELKSLWENKKKKG